MKRPKAISKFPKMSLPLSPPLPSPRRRESLPLPPAWGWRSPKCSPAAKTARPAGEDPQRPGKARLPGGVQHYPQIRRFGHRSGQGRAEKCEKRSGIHGGDPGGQRGCAGVRHPAAKKINQGLGRPMLPAPESPTACDGCRALLSFCRFRSCGKSGDAL